MNAYSEAVTKIVDDYLERLKSQLRQVPAKDQNEFLREIASHIFEAYQHEDSGTDDVSRILRVLRNLGEPAEVVSDRLPGERSGSAKTWNVPLRLLGLILLAVFGIPLVFGAAGVLIGVLVGMAAVLVSYYAAAGVTALLSATFFMLGMSRFYQPELWDRLLAMGIIHMDVNMADFLDRLSPSAQGNLFILCAIILASVALAMLWCGRYLVRALRFLVGLAFDRIRLLINRVGRRVKPVSIQLVEKLQRA